MSIHLVLRNGRVELARFPLVAEEDVVIDNFAISSALGSLLSSGQWTLGVGDMITVEER